MNEPPDQTAELSAANLLSSGGITVEKYFLNKSGYFFNPSSVSRNMTPCSSKSSLNLW